MRAILFVVLFLSACTLLSGCATLPDKRGAEYQQKQRNHAEISDQSVSLIRVDTPTKKKEVYFSTSYEMSSSVTKTGSANAKKCEIYAGFKSVVETWLDVCEAALNEPDLSAQNRLATLYNKGLIHMRQNEIETALSLFDAALEIDEDFAPSFLAKAMIASNKHQYERAVSLANISLAKGLLNTYEAYNVIGYAREGQFEFDKARSAYLNALKIRPGASDARLNLERVNRLWPAKPVRNFATEI